MSEAITRPLQDGSAGALRYNSDTEKKRWRFRFVCPSLSRFAAYVALIITSCVLLPRAAPFQADSNSEVPPSMSLEEVELRRMATLQENYKLPSRGTQKEQILPGVALVFLTIRGVRHRTLWQRWFEDAYAWLEDQGLEMSHSSDLNEKKHRSALVRAYVHHPYWLDPGLKSESVPAAMRPGIVEDSADCTWQTINPCFHRGLKEALNNFLTAQWFYTVSADAVPIKSFSELYLSLLDDPRSRLEFVKMVFDRNVPKVFNWVLYTREITAVLVDRPETWINESFRTNEERRWQAGADEWAVHIPLIDHFGEAFFQRQHPGVILLDPESRPLDFVVNTFACWNGCHQYGVPEGTTPPLFRLLYRSGFERMHTSATAAHARKFDINTMVSGCPVRRNQVIPNITLLSLEDIRFNERKHFAAEMRSTAGRNRSGRVVQPASWAGANFGPYYSDANCSITDFLSWRLNLNSTALADEEHEPFTLKPPGFREFANVEEQHEALVLNNVYGVRPELTKKYMPSKTSGATH